MLTIALAGHLCVDLTPDLPGTPRLVPGELVEVGPLGVALGGCTANTARALAALGHPVSVHAAVGDDELGRVARDGLTDPLVRPALEVRAGATSYSVVVQPPGADRVFWHHTGANATFDGAGLDVTGLDLLHLGYPALLPALLADDGRPLAALRGRARAAGATTSVDLGVVDRQTDVGRLDWRSLLERACAQTDVLSPSLDDLTSTLGLPAPAGATEVLALADELADQLLAWGVAVVLVTLGDQGALLRVAGAERLAAGGRALAPLAARWAGASLHLPALAVERTTTTNGAGDASSAGLLHALSLGAGPEAAARLARACAAAVVSGVTPDAGHVAALDPDLAALLGVGPAPAAPLPLPPNQPRARFYAGGERLATFRGQATWEPHTPEDWVGSVTTVRGEVTTGLTRLPSGELLREAVERDPVGWLGAAHAARWGADPQLLVKLLDAGQRLPVHVHPDDAFAARHLGAAHGKAEAWHVLEPGVVHVGLRRAVAPGELARAVAEQDDAALLDLLHEVPVAAGDSVLVPPGTLHAVGEGVVLVEVQQPEDLSILLEWRGFAIDGRVHGHLGLGFDTALTAVDPRVLDEEALARLVVRGRPAPGLASGLAAGAEAWFRLEEVAVGGPSGPADVELEDGFAVLVGVEGDVVATGSGGCTPVARGATTLVPAAAGRVRLTGRGRVLVARPPRP
ncbi:PfkB family carbohydrate kinase [Kineococcus endophyticus]|uniref:PfkB family carbohydrate kinase n=1 Tax=Kineococcus endophyticus TaxID=1181883 RepID=A0ABV3P5D4_9ACTN